LGRVDEYASVARAVLADITIGFARFLGIRKTGACLKTMVAAFQAKFSTQGTQTHGWPGESAPIDRIVFQDRDTGGQIV
jgi:hypothetical protein